MDKMPGAVVGERMHKMGMPVNVWILLAMLLFAVICGIAAFAFPVEMEAALAVRGVKEISILILSIAGFVAVFL